MSFRDYVSGTCWAPPTAIFRVKLQFEQDGAVGSLNLCSRHASLFPLFDPPRPALTFHWENRCLPLASFCDALRALARHDHRDTINKKSSTNRKGRLRACASITCLASRRLITLRVAH